MKSKQTADKYKHTAEVTKENVNKQLKHLLNCKQTADIDITV